MKTYLTFFLCAFLFALTGCKDEKLFTLIKSSHSSINFNNRIIENDSMNPLKEVNVYNGGGVGIGDFNKDGLMDIYFTANMVANKLYLNKGDFKFEDITEASGTGGNGAWSRGVSVVDINGDGWDDIYVSVAITKNASKRKNLLFVNQVGGVGKQPVFKEMGAEYGLDDTTHTAMSYFFDYDNDGDLDVYLVVNNHVSTENQNKFRPIKADGKHPSTGRLYQNTWSEKLQHPFYTNVSDTAGIKTEGYGHAAVIGDFNRDGWKDIYVTNDFISNNILYINNRNGTFTDSTKQYFKQTSTFSMGADMQDINNDGLEDIIELDMNPEDNYRDKMIMGENSYQYIDNFTRHKYQLQYMRNTLQLNQGNSLRSNDTIGNPVFSQVAFMAGIAETDWSWGPIVSDFDNDGFRDIIITNGYPKDITNHDFMVYRDEASSVASPSFLLQQVPEVKIRNYAYRNTNGLQFENKTDDWGFDIKSFSNGGVYADLDNDGDMDIVINNINDEAFVYRNNMVKNDQNNYLNIVFEGNKMNGQGFGTFVTLYYGEGKKQVFENSPYRGYVSTHQPIAHFGLGSNKKVDSIKIVWPDFKVQVLKDVEINKTLTCSQKNASGLNNFYQSQLATGNIFTELSANKGISYVENEKDYPDFTIQKLLPHKFTEYSPALAVGDLNGDGLDDMVCGGTSANPTTLFFQQKNGSFSTGKLSEGKDIAADTTANRFSLYTIGSEYKDGGILLFDADGDGDNDIYITAAGYAYKQNSVAYSDRLYINDGKGSFVLTNDGLPQDLVSKLCVRAADIDKDGDMDLLVTARVQPVEYPKAVSSRLLRNDSKNGKIVFTDITKNAAPELLNIGLICDAVFSDYDGDGWQDIVLAGEWMPITFLKNNKGNYTNQTKSSGITNITGWWNTIAPGDFDNDGDIDYIVGNLGLNSFYHASNRYPAAITANDFDSNGSYDAIPSLFTPASEDDREPQEFPASTRDEMIKQMIGIKRKFTDYHSFALAPMDKILSPEQRSGALRLEANHLSHVLVKNDGNGKFSMTELPIESQVSVLNGMVVEDFDGDGNLDVVSNGNDYGTNVSVGRYDALNGLFLKGNGKGKFKPLSILESGIYLPGNGKGLVTLKGYAGEYLLAASEHNGPIKVFGLKKNNRMIPIETNDASALITYKNGNRQRREFYTGYSFLSQSANCILINDNMTSVVVTDKSGKERTLLN